MNTTKLRNLKNQSGFTLIELLVVIGILAILLAITIVALNPVQHFQAARNTQRQSDVVTILDAIYQYEAAKGGVLSGSTAIKNISTTAGTPSPITSVAGGSNIDLCADLVTNNFVADLPVDPTTGTRAAATSCAGTYATGYTVYRNATSNRFTVSAPAAENGQIISVTR